MTHRARLIIENAHDSTIRLRIEPWADEYDLSPGTRGTIHSFGPSQVDVLVQFGRGYGLGELAWQYDERRRDRYGFKLSSS